MKESFLEQDLILKTELEERKLRLSVYRRAMKAKTQTIVVIRGRGRGSFVRDVEADFIVFEAEGEGEEEDGGMLMRKREEKRFCRCVGLKRVRGKAIMVENRMMNTILEVFFLRGDFCVGEVLE